MSSIYKKGRDGYYYYQAYVYNPKSKKKDKRVFHALNTKDLTEAESKKLELDLKYISQKTDNSNLLKSLKNYKTWFFTGIGLIILANWVFIFNGMKNESRNDYLQDNINANSKLSSTPKNKDTLNFKIETEIAARSQIIDEKIEKEDHLSNISLPKFTIEREERLSEAFTQLKLYITINENTSVESQQKLCEHLNERFYKYSNIVICLYTNNLLGKNFAMGNYRNIGIEQQKKTWLAMYTYNKVEGAFFDDTPTRYLGYK